MSWYILENIYITIVMFMLKDLKRQVLFKLLQFMLIRKIFYQVPERPGGTL